MEQPLDNELRNEDAQEFRSFKNFIKKEDAQEFAQFLKDNNIPALVESTKVLLDSAIVGNDNIPRTVVKVQAQNFPKVNQLIAQSLGELNYEMIKNHHLNQLDDEELQDILLKPDEWTVESVQIAKVLLKERGIDVSDQEVQQMEIERLAEFKEGKAAKPIWIVVYATCMILGIFADLMVLIAGVSMSLYYGYGKTTAPDGRKYFVYNKQTRTFGRYLFVIGLVLILVEILIIYKVIQLF